MVSQTTLPGSKGTLMVIVGGIAAIGSLLALLVFSLRSPSWRSTAASDSSACSSVSPAALMMGWAGWKEFQAEGGKFQLGSAPGRQPASSASRRRRWPRLRAPPPAAPPTHSEPTRNDEPRVGLNATTALSELSAP